MITVSIHAGATVDDAVDTMVAVGRWQPVVYQELKVTQAAFRDVRLVTKVPDHAAREQLIAFVDGYLACRERFA